MKMKQILSITAIFLMFLVGCSNDVNINNPIGDPVKEEFVTRGNLGGLQLNKSLTISREIDGKSGGFLFVGDILAAQNGNMGSIYAACYFPSGSFSGKKIITMTVDDSTLTGTFSPHMIFDKPVSFSVLFTGVDLSRYYQSQFSFVYYGADGIKHSIPSSFIYFDKVKGVLGILNAQLPHFSRYGFIRKADIKNITTSAE
jgi:hypothetical protein